VFVASRVITGLAASPMKGIAYSFGFAAGVFFGSLLEQKLALGKLLVQTITSDEKGKEISQALRNSGYGVTTIEAKGKDEAKTIVMVYSNRRGSQEITEIVLKHDPSALIVVDDVSKMVGGYVPSGKSIIK
jgi:uncharacterized protein YebE (UPF0316 family)